MPATRADNTCELCSATDDLATFPVGSGGVKGAGFTARRGTAVRGISLVADNPGQIEGRVEGQRIVILTEFVMKR